MKISFLTILLALGLAGCGDGSVTVKDEPDVFTARLPKFKGTHHGDGVAGVLAKGIVLDRKTKAPLAGATFRVEPTRIFSDIYNDKVHFVTTSDGQFEFPMKVGAAIAMDGTKTSDVYQTAKAKLIIELIGYESASVLVDYQMPPMRILMKKK